MLDAIRKRTGSIVVKILLGFLVLSFAVWGIGDYVTGSAAGGAVATIKDREISVQRFSDEMRREVARLRQFLGNTATLETLRELGLDRELLNRLIGAELFDLAADDHGLIIPDAVVSAEVRSMPQFAGLTGQFDHEVFRRAIGNAGYSENDFLDLFRRETKERILLDALNTGAVLPEQVVDKIFAYRNERREIAYIQIADSDFLDIATPTTAEIAAYHQENQDRFMAPEYRDVTFIHLKADDLAETIDVREEDIEDAFFASEEDYVTRARRNIEQAIFDTKNQAIETKTLVESGVSFSEAVSQVKGTPTRDLSLGWVVPSDLLGEDTVQAVFGAAKGDLAGPVQSPLGWLLFSIVGAEDEARLELEDVRDDLKRQVARERAIDELFELANEMDDLLASGMSLEEVAATLNLSAETLRAVSQSGEGENGIAIEGLPGGDFISTVFLTEEGSESPLIEVGEDAYFVVRVNGIQETALRPLDEARDRVVAAMMADRRAQQAEILAREIASRLGASTSLTAQVEGLQYVVAEANSVRRNGTGLPEGIPRSLATAVFDVSVGSGVFVRTVEGFVVAHVLSSEQAPIDRTNPDYAALKNRLEQRLRGDLTATLREALLSRYPVSINLDAMNHVYGVH